MITTSGRNMWEFWKHIANICKFSYSFMGAPCVVNSDVIIIVCYENNFVTRKHVV